MLGLLYLGQRWDRQRLVRILVAVGLLLPVVLPFFNFLWIRFQEFPSRYRLALVPSIFYVMSVFLPELVTLGVYAILQYCLKKHLSPGRIVLIIGCLFLSGYLLLLYVLFIRPIRDSEQFLCDPTREAVGNMAQVYFVELITKTELKEILEKYHLRAYRITLGRKGGDFYQITHTYGGERQLQANDLDVSIKQTDAVDFERQISSMGDDLDASFDRGEAVMWGIQFYKHTIGEVVPFLREYDQRGKLGILIEPSGRQVPMGVNMPLEYIKPPTKFPRYRCLESKAR